MSAVLILALFAPILTQQPPPADPPAVNEEALARRLFAMAAPTGGERAVIVFDPTYYPGITRRLREALHDASVETVLLVEDTPTMIERYLQDPDLSRRREEAVVELLRPVFRAADIFYWMPTRGYGDDLRWERLVADSRVRSIHFHWLLRFPGGRSAEDIESASRGIERRALEVDLTEHARAQRRLAEALRGQMVRITTPAGTDLSLEIPRAQWFHFGDGDASKARAATARSIRDRQMELPVGMFMFVPDGRTFRGTLAAPSIVQAGNDVKDLRFDFQAGRVTHLSAAAGEPWLRDRIRHVGPDGDRIATIFINTHPMTDHGGVVIDVGSNWENGGTNRAVRMRRMTIRLEDATITTSRGTLMRDGRLLWAEIR
jgi:hypothetical protein